VSKKQCPQRPRCQKKNSVPSVPGVKKKQCPQRPRCQKKTVSPASPVSKKNSVPSVPGVKKKQCPQRPRCQKKSVLSVPGVKKKQCPQRPRCQKKQCPQRPRCQKKNSVPSVPGVKKKNSVPSVPGVKKNSVLSVPGVKKKTVSPASPVSKKKQCPQRPRCQKKQCPQRPRCQKKNSVPSVPGVKKKQCPQRPQCQKKQCPQRPQCQKKNSVPSVPSVKKKTVSPAFPVSKKNSVPSVPSVKKKIMTTSKNTLHPRNRHKGAYDFSSLLQACPELEPYVHMGKSERLTIDFSDPEAVKYLNKALLIKHYGITYWDIPPGYLCPAVPSRADYLHYAADLLADPHTGDIPRGKSVRVLDIGVGANGVYPIIGHRQYGWQFVGSDIDPIAVKAASAIVEANKVLRGGIEIRLQKNPQNIFKGVVRPGEQFDLCISNPPYFHSEEQAARVAGEKWKKLGLKAADNNFRNFGGQANELETKGGEVGFIQRMITESQEFADSFQWFTTLVSNRNSWPAVRKALKRVGAAEVKEMVSERGQKMTRIIAWHFRK
jgi:23S rRNA (adenine1618-N6)-methyltransferase